MEDLNILHEILVFIFDQFINQPLIIKMFVLEPDHISFLQFFVSKLLEKYGALAEIRIHLSILILLICKNVFKNDIIGQSLYLSYFI